MSEIVWGLDIIGALDDEEGENGKDNEDHKKKKLRHRKRLRHYGNTFNIFFFWA